MPLCSLLQLPIDDRAAQGFVFDHDQAHRDYIIIAGLPSNRPAIIDPAPIAYTSRIAGNWHHDHQRSHDDFSLNQTKAAISQNLIDSTLAEPASLEWWTFVNHMQHYIDQQTA
jgi:hypothetical protein